MATDRKPDDPQQSQRFLEAAREHKAATTEEAARKAFRKVVGKPTKERDDMDDPRPVLGKITPPGRVRKDRYKG